MGRPARRHANHPHPHPRFPHLGHDSPGGLVQQEERYPGLGHEDQYCTLQRSKGALSVGQIVPEVAPQTA